MPHSVHPFADRADVLIVHVTHFNALFWDCRSAPTMIVEHGMADPGLRYTGERRALAFVVNEPVRRWRTTGTDLLPTFGEFPVDAFGIDADRLPDRLGGLCPELRTPATSAPANCCRPGRAPGLPASEPVDLARAVADPGHDARSAGPGARRDRSVPRCAPGAGALSTDVEELRRTAQLVLDNPAEAARRGLVAREAALERYGLQRFLADWDRAFSRALELVGRA